ncbi:MAG: hypothetical protein Udaeo2_04340 [Candidatus Udaeobacter sp.]|nr:MAG: hypothetical protein Udaeo2_04340 [Candidatus Udaeobacter sp.]
MFAQDACRHLHPHAGAVGWAASSIHFPDAVPNTRMPDFEGLRSICKSHRRPSSCRSPATWYKIDTGKHIQAPCDTRFSDNQRIEIYLTNSEGNILTKWSDNHAIAEKPATILINPRSGSSTTKQSQRATSRQTRSLSPRCFSSALELRVRQKFLAVP